MKIFVGWSGDRSKAVAAALRDWIPLVLHEAEPWLPSRQDACLEDGKDLEGSQFGILCVTRESLDTPWLHFDAGALSQRLEAAAIWPCIVDVDPGELDGPLAHLRPRRADKRSTYELLYAINARSSRRLEGVRLANLFEPVWPELERRLRAIMTSSPSSARPGRSQSDILEGLVAAVRGVENRLSNIEETLTTSRRAPLSQSMITQLPPKPAERKPKAAKATMLTIQVDASIGRLQPGQSLRVYCEGDIVDSLKQFGLNDVDYGRTWILRDSSEVYMTREQCANVSAYFGGRACRLTLDEIVGA